MAKGRPADPTRARRGTGNRPKPGEAKKLNAPIVPLAGSAVAVPDQYAPPPDLPVEVHQVWRAAIADLGGANHMRDSFIPILVAYCHSAYVHAEASANIAKYGVLVKGATGPVANPLLKVQKESAATMLRLAETLGLTPAARIRVGLMEVTGMSLLAGINQALGGK